MAVITVPNNACTFTAAACLPSACDRWLSLGFSANSGGSGSVAFWSGSAVADGSPLLTIVCASGQLTYQSPIFNSPLGVMVASIAGGSAIVWTRQPHSP